ncbi:transcriptional corepressor LEUNIG-like [Dorcoceras hygrometricum]|uniref:Transcriptional corepressor LEUNIG-like n=1 Tax=Dorcoceras hygrometricum TaxID=472368 RepID=A0A2Z7B2Y0_9LAMI|nr:transcriptional corepressor LEUNIG-like [Dorcoceras hygrometricum]
MMNSRRICPADGSQYKDSAVGLVLMESAAGLAMETSKVESVLDIQTQATAHPVESFNEPAVAMNPVASFAYPVDMESSRKKTDVVESYNPDARYPVAVFEASAVAQSIQSTKKQLLREVL